MCLYPINIKYLDRVRGGYSMTTVGCGKCIECLKDKQDEWSIRIQQEAQRSKGFIFDTFTYNDNSIPSIDAHSLDIDLSSISDESLDYLNNHDWIIHFPKYEDVRDVIKRGRELYYKHHKIRLKFKYFICSEYGDKKTNNYRPHFHLCVFGITRSNWLEYFAIPWQKRFGFTYTKEIDFYDKQHVINVARYVGKYCAKGFFEPCIVRDGFAPKPFRLVSNGIGVDYLDTFRKQVSAFEKYISEFSCLPSSSRGFYSAIGSDNKYRELLRLFNSEEIYNSLCLFDSSSYPHRLPRYYKDKLFGVEPSIWKTCLSSFIQHRQEREYFICLQGYAKKYGFKDFKRAWNQAARGNPTPEFVSLCDAFDSSEKANKSLSSKRLYNKLQNFYL